jgi:type I restriction enzyme R subunit
VINSPSCAAFFGFIIIDEYHRSIYNLWRQERRERLTRKKRWERQDEEEQYAATQLDRAVVNPDQIRTVIRTFRDKLPDIFPGRKEVPKTLVFAKTDSHADDVIQIIREEFSEGN